MQQGEETSRAPSPSTAHFPFNFPPPSYSLLLILVLVIIVVIIAINAELNGWEKGNMAAITESGKPTNNTRT
jgi:hypothetical protein